MGKRRILTLIAGVACVGAATLAGYSAYADTNGNANVTMQASLDASSVSLSTSGNIQVNVIPTSGGSLGVGKGTVTVTSSSGYQLYISGTQSGSNGYLPLNYNGNADASSKIAGMAVNTPTAFSSAYANSWGYAVAGNGSAGNFSTAATYNSAVGNNITDSTTLNNLKWQGVNNTYKQIKATTNANDKTTDVYYGVYANTDMMAGDYRNTITYTAFVEGADRLEVYPSLVNSDDTMTITAEYKSGTLPITNANQITVSLLDGNTTIGTCNNINISSNGSSNLLAFTCKATKNGSAQSNTLYDVKVNLSVPGRSDTLSFQANDSFMFPLTMQDLAAIRSTGNSKGVGVPFEAKDTRTDKSYRITKLADGQYWMTQNLWLEGGSTITTANGNSYTLPASDTYGYNEYGADAKMYQGTHVDYMVDTTDTNTGSFFKWKVATAGTGGGYEVDQVATDSVCPQGWHLPTGGDSGEFKALYNNSSYSSYDNFKADNAWSVATASTALQGFCKYSGCPTWKGSEGYWWSSTQYNSTNAYALGVNTYTPSVEPTTHGSDGGIKYDGDSVRCVLSAS